MARGAFMKHSVPLGRTGGLLTILLAFLAGGCGATAWQGPVTRDAFAEMTSARSAMTAQTDAAVTSLVAARRRGKGEVIPGFEILVGFTVRSGSWIADKPVAYDGPGFTPVLWNQAYTPPSGFDVQLVLKRPPRSSASLAAGDTFMIFRFSIESFSGQTIPLGAAPDSLSIVSFWLEGRTVLDPLGGSSIRPYLQYGGGLAKYSAVEIAGVPIWEPDALEFELGWRMSAGLEARWAKLGVYLEYGVQAIGASRLADAAGGAQGQELVTFPLRVGVILSF